MFNFLFNQKQGNRRFSKLKAKILEKRKEDVRLTDVPKTLQRDFDVAKFLIEKHPEDFRYMPTIVRKDFELSIFAVNKAKYNASFSLCEDEDYLLEVVNQNPSVIVHMKDKIKSSFILQAVFDTALSSVSKRERATYDLISSLPPEFLDNEYCGRKLLDINTINLHRLSERLQNKKDFLLDYMSHKGSFYEALPERHKKNMKLIRAALKTFPQLVTILPHELQKKLPVEIYNKALNKCYDNQFILNPQNIPSKDPVECIAPDVLNRHLIAKTVLTRTISVQSVLLRMDADNRNNEELVAIAVKRNGNELQGASYKLRSDLSIVLEAVKQNYEAFLFITSELIENKDKLKQILSSNGLCYRYLIKRRYDEELLDTAMQSNPAALVFAPITAQIDTKYHLKYFFNSPIGFDSFMSTSLRNDHQMLCNFENALSKEAIHHPERFRQCLHKLNESNKHYEGEYRGIQWVLHNTDKETLTCFKTKDAYLNELLKLEISRKQILAIARTNETETGIPSTKKKRKILTKC